MRLALLAAVASFACACTPASPDPIAAIESHATFAERLKHAEGIRGAGAAFVTVTRAARPALTVAVPSSAAGVARLSIDDERWIEIRALDVVDAPLRLVGDALVTRDALEDADLVLLHEPRGLEELRVLRSGRARTTFRYDIACGAAVTDLVAHEGRVFARAADGTAVFATDEIFAEDQRGVHRRLAVSIKHHGAHHEITAVLDTSQLTFPIVVDPAWAAAGNVGTAVSYPTLTPLSNGKILLAGGLAAGGPTSTTALFDGSVWTPGPAMSSPRFQHFAVRLDTGKVLIGGGERDGGGLVSSTVEEYDPATNTFGATATMSTPRARAAAAVVGSGRVLVFGGNEGPGNAASQTYEVWLTGSNAFGPNQSVPPIVGARARAVAVPVGGTQVLVAGGTSSGVDYASGAVYDSATNIWTAVPNSMPGPRVGAQAVVKAGVVLIAGGYAGGDPTQGLSTAVQWTPGPGFEAVGSMSGGRSEFAMVLVSDNALATGGFPTSSTAETYDFVTRTWSAAGTLVTPRTGHAGAPLGTGSAVLAGGYMFAGHLSTSEVWTASAGGTDAGVGDAGPATYRCTTSTECQMRLGLMICVNGFCCQSSCSMTCGRCGVPGSLGQCAPYSGPSLAAECPSGMCANGQCAAGASKELGIACAMGMECQSGNCVDGVCCDGPCAGTCTHCNLPSSAGRCKPFTGIAKTAECPDPAMLCEQGQCRKPEGSAQPNGTACTAGGACASGICADNVCCDTSCIDSCRACNMIGKEGTCTGLFALPSHPLRPCPGAEMCGPDGACPVVGDGGVDASAAGDGAVADGTVADGAADATTGPTDGTLFERREAPSCAHARTRGDSPFAIVSLLALALPLARRRRRAA